MSLDNNVAMWQCGIMAWIQIKAAKCDKCGWTWEPYSENPKFCPRCRSKAWNQGTPQLRQDAPGREGEAKVGQESQNEGATPEIEKEAKVRESRKISEKSRKLTYGELLEPTGEIIRATEPDGEEIQLTAYKSVPVKNHAPNCFCLMCKGK